MAWPLASHFSAMLQNPRIAFRDPQLQGCTIEKNELNQPRPWSGAFAVVYRATLADGCAMAVRCFTTESPERRERYDLMSDYLKTRRLRCLVDFEYRDRGIRSAGDGKWYPLILMDWVEGETLFTWVRARALEGDRPALATAAERWLELVKELADARIAHGDLQHANVMVTPAGELKLVDYDCMCVPALVGRRNLEVGVEPYQHPQRNESTHLSPDLDNFSALVIYVALRALAADPTLWVTYVEEPAYDKLLFRSEDFRAAEQSPLMRRLDESPAGDVRQLAQQLVALWRGPMDQVPPLVQLTHSYAEVERLLFSRQWEEAVRLLNRRGQFRDAPEHLQPLIHQAYEYVCRKKAWKSFQKLPQVHSEANDRRLVDAWNEALFAGFEPAERQRPRVLAARKHVRLLDRLQHLIQQAGRTPDLAQQKAIVNLAQHLPRGYRHGLAPQVRRARLAVDGCRQLEAAIAEEDDRRIAAAWDQLVQARSEALATPQQRARVQVAKQRLPLLESLRSLSPDMPPEELDRRLLALWDEQLLANHPEAERWRPAYETACHRQELLQRIEEAIRCGDQAAIDQWVRDPSLADYPMPASWQPVIEAARDQMARLAALEQALADGDRAAFVQRFDARLIRRFPERFQPFGGQLAQWTAEEILAAETVGLRPAIARASVVLIDKSQRAFRIRWTWPQPRFADQCILAICPEQPEVGQDPQGVPASFREAIDRIAWEGGGGSRLIRAASKWVGQWVVVWAVVDLGIERLFSHPLILGRLVDHRKGPAGPRGLRFLLGLVRRAATDRQPTSGPPEGSASPSRSGLDQGRDGR